MKRVFIRENIKGTVVLEIIILGKTKKPVYKKNQVLLDLEHF